MKEKLSIWAVNNIFNLRNTTTTELLNILNEAGHSELPKTAETLLETKKCVNNSIIIPSAKGNNGIYTYFGIKNVLKKMLNSANYEDSKVKILVNIDGIPIYEKSTQQFWPILIKIFHTNYTCSPGIVALYCGDSKKPASVDQYLEDFIN